MIVQQKRKILRRRIVKIPDFLGQKSVVLRIDVQCRVIRQIHSLSRPLKGIDFFFGQPKLLFDRGKEIFLPEDSVKPGRPFQVVLREHIRVIIIVHKAGVFVRAGYAVDAEPPPAVIAGIHPEPRRLEDNLRAAPGDQREILCQKIIADDGICDIPVDVVLRAAGRKIAGTLFSHNRPPGVERALFVPHNPRVFPRRGKRGIAVLNQVFGDFRHGQQEKRLNIHFRIPEIVPLIPLAGKTFCRNIAVGIFSHGLNQLIQIIGNGVAQSVVSLDMNGAAFPVFFQVLLL